MGFEQCNERFYLFADLLNALEGCRRSLQAQLDIIQPADLDSENSSDDADMPDDSPAADRPADPPANPPTFPPANPEAEQLSDMLAELDERGEELTSCENHTDLYTRHLLRKALSSTITIEFLKVVQGQGWRIHAQPAPVSSANQGVVLDREGAAPEGRWQSCG